MSSLTDIGFLTKKTNKHITAIVQSNSHPTYQNNQLQCIEKKKFILQIHFILTL